MANRIYIAIGLIAILILGAAFAVPWFIDWNAYKGRMEQMTADALGVEVEIAGDMDFVLLPQPRMRMEEVRIGPAIFPLGEAQLVEADFSLLDFLRDRFTVTQLRVIEPQINLIIDADGHLETPITLAETATASNVSVANARFENGALRVTDLRSEETWEATAFSGDMRMAALRGPFSLDGQADLQGTPHAIRFATSAMNAEGEMQVTAFTRPETGSYSAAVEGLLRTGSSPEFEGTLTYRQASLVADDGVTGDVLLTSPITGNSREVLLTGFTLLPDENQAATRLTGHASVALGEAPSFNAVVSGGVVTLLPPQVEEADAGQPFEVVRMLREMPEPMIPAMRGRIGMDINELVVRGVSLRDVRLDAVTNGEVWSVEEMSGRLAGDTTVKLTGTLGRAAGWPAFDGTLAMASRRLDALSLLWKRPQEGNPLFNMPGSLNGRIQLSNESLRLREGLFVLDETNHEVSADIRFGSNPSLAVNAQLSALSRGQSAALLALIPPVEDGSAFSASFPQGTLGINAEAGAVAGQRFSDAAFTARWGEGAVTLENVEIGDFGGVSFEGEGRLAGTLAQPEISGSGQMQVQPRAAALDLVFAGAGQNNPLRAAIAGSLPANVSVTLERALANGGQNLVVEGRAGVADVWASLEMAGGIAQLGQRDIGLTLEAVADNGFELQEQLGLRPVIEGADGALLNLTAFGNPRGNLETELTLEGGGERVDFTGTLMVADASGIRGQGQTSFLFEDNTLIAELAGAEGIWFPGVEGQAQIGFVGGDSVTLDEIAAYADERYITGNLTYAGLANSTLLSGALNFDALDLETLAAMLGGPASVIETMPGLIPDGPIDVGQSPRTSRGRISVTSPQLDLGEGRSVEALTFDYSWDAEETRLRSLFGEFGGGTVQLEAALCCATNIPAKSLTGRVTVNGVALDDLLPEASAAALEGTLSLGGQFQANGDSYRALAQAMNGEGSFTVEGLRIENLSPDVFGAAADVEDLTEIAPEDLEALVTTALGSGPFTADEAGGLFTMTGGSARASNIAIDGRGARLLGRGSLALATLGISGDWTLALTRILGGNDLITETTGRIGIGVSGTLTAPESTLDLSPMVDAIQMRAYEIELDELERLRAEQEARQRAAAEEQARMMEEEARRQAEELLRQQQEEADRQRALERQRELEELQNQLSREPEAGEADDADAGEEADEEEGQPESVFPQGPSILDLQPRFLPPDDSL